MSAVGHRRRIASTASRMLALAWKGVAIVPSSRNGPGASGCRPGGIRTFSFLGAYRFASSSQTVRPLRRMTSMPAFPARTGRVAAGEPGAHVRIIEDAGRHERLADRGLAAPSRGRAPFVQPGAGTPPDRRHGRAGRRRMAASGIPWDSSAGPAGRVFRRTGDAHKQEDGPQEGPAPGVGEQAVQGGGQQKRDEHARRYASRAGAGRVCIVRIGYAWGMHHVMHTFPASLFRMVPPVSGGGLRRYAWYACPIRENPIKRSNSENRCIQCIPSIILLIIPCIPRVFMGSKVCVA